MLAAVASSAALTSQRLAVRALTAPPAAAYHVRAALSLLAESAEDGGEDSIARVVRDELSKQEVPPASLFSSQFS